MTARRRLNLSGPLLVLRASLVFGAIAVAYHYSLLTLLRNLTLDTPLAYLGLVPFIALLLAVVAGRRWRWEPDVHDRYVDYIVGIPLLVVALLILVVVPAVLSSFYWRWRLDLLSLPLFVAGAVVLVFGLRSVLRVKIAIAFLFLAWPLPYTLLLNDALQAYTATTIQLLRDVVGVVPVAQAVGGPDSSLFRIPHGPDGFVVSVASACAGVNGSLGFLLVGGAIAGISGGGLLRKGMWLANGMVLTLALNLARIVAIFAAGDRWGEEFAIGALHPVIGLATFNVGILVTVLALPLFGLDFDPRPRRPPVPLAVPAASGANASQPRGVRMPLLGPRRLPVQRAAIALSVVVAASALAGTADAGLGAFQGVADDLGPPRLGEWSPAVAAVAGWTVRQTNSYPWVVQYFGAGATWNRYAYLAPPDARTADSASGSPAVAGTPPSGRPGFVNLDVISTWDLGTFSTYGLEACYGFHDYQVLAMHRVDVGGGVVGHVISYVDPGSQGAWTALYWEWPVQAGGRERYERVILNVRSDSAGLPPEALPTTDPFGTFQLAVAAMISGSSNAPDDPRLDAVRQFLVGFARALVVARAEHASVDRAAPANGSPGDGL